MEYDLPSLHELACLGNETCAHDRIGLPKEFSRRGSHLMATEPADDALLATAVAGDRTALERLLLLHCERLSRRIAAALPTRRGRVVVLTTCCSRRWSRRSATLVASNRDRRAALRPGSKPSRIIEFKTSSELRGETSDEA